MTAIAPTGAPAKANGLGLDQRDWRAAALAMLSIRVIQGFIYWGGGSRRFIYAPWKLDPDKPSWMANKLQAAMPGALFWLDQAIAFLLHHFWLLYAAIVFFSAAELIAGAALIAGFMTRLAAFISVGLSVALMLIFGWQGGTCVDEWTMAACNLAMGATLMLAGAAAYSLDNAFLRRNPRLAERAWFRWGGGSLKLPLSERGFRALALALLAFVVVFNVGAYDYYRGSVLTSYHGGTVSPRAHHVTLAGATLLADGGVRFHAYLDGGTPAVPAHLMKAELLAADGKAIATWDAAALSALSALSAGAIANDFPYNTFKAGPFGLEAGVGAAATIVLPPAAGSPGARAGDLLRLTDVDGKTFEARIAPSLRILP